MGKKYYKYFLTLTRAIKSENLKLPGFLKNLDEYKAALDRMAATNFIDSLK